MFDLLEADTEMCIHPPPPPDSVAHVISLTDGKLQL